MRIMGYPALLACYIRHASGTHEFQYYRMAGQTVSYRIYSRKRAQHADGSVRLRQCFRDAHSDKQVARRRLCHSGPPLWKTAVVYAQLHAIWCAGLDKSVPLDWGLLPTPPHLRGRRSSRLTQSFFQLSLPLLRTHCAYPQQYRVQRYCRRLVADPTFTCSIPLKRTFDKVGQYQQHQ